MRTAQSVKRQFTLFYLGGWIFFSGGNLYSFVAFWGTASFKIRNIKKTQRGTFEEKMIDYDVE